mmetsp:Transcript_51660/g.118677  ORF Transcript_51660/g.118677 Transcript_51660/m.118677 type:complete len:497 (-) Transcript_51660:1282-2772(-)
MATSERSRLVHRICGRDKDRVLLGKLRVFEQLFARVLVLEHLDLVLGSTEARDAARERSEQRLLVRTVQLAAGAGAGEHLLRQLRFERIFPIDAPLLAVVLVILAEHGQRVRRDHVHRAAREGERRALGRRLDVAEHDSLLGHARVVERVGTAVVAADEDLVEACVPQDGHQRVALHVELRDALHRAQREEVELRCAVALAHRGPRHEHPLVRREVDGRHRRDARKVAPLGERRVESAKVPYLERAIGRAAREDVAVLSPAHARHVRARRVRAPSHCRRAKLLRLKLAHRHALWQQHYWLVLRRTELPQLQRAVLGAAQQRVAVRPPRSARRARLDPAAVLEHAHALLAALHVEAHVVALHGDLRVPQPHRAVLRACRKRVVLVHVPARARARGHVSLGVPHVANVRVTLHQRAQLAPVAVEDDRLVAAARDNQLVCGRAVVDRAQLHLAERLLDVSEGAQLLRHASEVPEVDVAVGAAGDEPPAAAIQRQAGDRL